MNFSMILFMIANIVANLGIVTDWFGFNYTNTNNLLDLYDEYMSW